MSAHKAQTPGTGDGPAQGGTPDGAVAKGAAAKAVPTEGSASDAVPADSTVQTAGAFDIRNFIGSLLALFGLILLGAGLFAFDGGAAAKTDGLNANLWAGAAMLVVGILFMVWTKLDPIRMIVRNNEDGAEEPRDIAALD